MKARPKEKIRRSKPNAELVKLLKESDAPLMHLAAGDNLEGLRREAVSVNIANTYPLFPHNDSLSEEMPKARFSNFFPYSSNDFSIMSVPFSDDLTVKQVKELVDPLRAAFAAMNIELIATDPSGLDIDWNKHRIRSGYEWRKASRDQIHKALSELCDALERQIKKDSRSLA